MTSLTLPPRHCPVAARMTAGGFALAIGTDRATVPAHLFKMFRGLLLRLKRLEDLDDVHGRFSRAGATILSAPRQHVKSKSVSFRLLFCHHLTLSAACFAIPSRTSGGAQPLATYPPPCLLASRTSGGAQPLATPANGGASAVTRLSRTSGGAQPLATRADSDIDAARPVHRALPAARSRLQPRRSQSVALRGAMDRALPAARSRLQRLYRNPLRRLPSSPLIRAVSGALASSIASSSYQLRAIFVHIVDYAASSFLSSGDGPSGVIGPLEEAAASMTRQAFSSWSQTTPHSSQRWSSRSGVSDAMGAPQA